MICPFRTDVVLEYEKVWDGNKTTARLKAQREVFPPCESYNCPFWDVTTCNRAANMCNEELEEE